MASTVWRGYISFGLISIPVRLFRAARAERINLRKLYKSSAAPSSSEPADPEDDEAPPAQPVLEPIRQVATRQDSAQALPAPAVVKGYEYEKDRFVALEPEELKNAAAKTSTAMEIAEFVQLTEIDPVYFETSYYVTPEEAGEKAYALLYSSLQSTHLVAIAQFAMHSREHVVVLRPGHSGLLAHTMFFASEVRADEEFHADTHELSKKELELAQTLIRSLEAPFEPAKYHDTYREKLQDLIDRKLEGKPLPAAPEAKRKAEVVDIADALRQSLANLKKQPAATTSASRKRTAAAKKAARG